MLLSVLPLLTMERSFLTDEKKKRNEAVKWQKEECLQNPL